MQFMQSIIDKNIDGNNLSNNKYLLLAVLLCVFLFLGGCVTFADQQPLTKATEQIKPSKTINAAPSPVDTLRVLAPNTGLKTTNLFTEPLRNTDDRVDRLETVVQEIKDDFDTVTPAVVRLVAIEQDIKDLVQQLGTLVDEDDKHQTIIAPILEGEDILPSDNVQLAQQPTKIDMNSPVNVNISDIQIEENANTTRLVMSLSDKVEFDTKIKDNGKSLSITLYNTVLNTQTHWESDFSPLIASYNITKQDNNQLAEVKLNFVSKLIKSEILPAKAGQGYKLILDMQSDAIHFP